MLDVHPPHEPVHGPRDFFLHLFTITIGLLIALGLEASVEALHHRHQREEAETNIRQELKENRASMVKMEAETKEESQSLERALIFLEDLRDGRKDDPSGIKLGFNSRPLQNAAWTTASATGALAYMDYAEAQRFATAYHEQENFEAAVANAIRSYEVLETYLADNKDPREMNPHDIEAGLPDLRRAIADLSCMYDWGRGALGTYDDALKP
jgi:hypothetical protein